MAESSKNKGNSPLKNVFMINDCLETILGIITFIGNNSVIVNKFPGNNLRTEVIRDSRVGSKVVTVRGQERPPKKGCTNLLVCHVNM